MVKQALAQLFIMKCKRQGVKITFANGAEFADNELLVAIKKFIDEREAGINSNRNGCRRI